MNAETKNELLRINQLFEEGKDVSYSELAFLEEHKQEVLDLGDIRLAERAGISEAEWNRVNYYKTVKLFVLGVAIYVKSLIREKKLI